MVRVTGLEPARRKTPDPKSGVSAIPPHPLMKYIKFCLRETVCNIVALLPLVANLVVAALSRVSLHRPPGALAVETANSATPAYSTPNSLPHLARKVKSNIDFFF